MGSEMTLREVLLADSYQQEIDALKAQLADAQAYATSAIAQRDKAEAENAKLRKVVEAAKDFFGAVKLPVEYCGKIHGRETWKNNSTPEERRAGLVLAGALAALERKVE